jgi:DNA modification methylase
MTATQTIHFGDSIEKLGTLNDNQYDLVISDPLFDMKDAEYVQMLKEVDRVSNENGTVYVFTDWQNLHRVQSLIKETTDWHQLNMIVWSRMSPGGNTKTYKTGYELILWFVKDKKNYKFNKQFRKISGKQVLPYKNADGSPRGWFYDESTGERTRWAETSNVWCYTRPTWSAEETVAHGMQKPLQLSDRIILTSTNEGDSVFDVFSGSGTFAVSAKILNRNYLGCERDPEYVKIIHDRLDTCFDLKYVVRSDESTSLEKPDQLFFEN